MEILNHQYDIIDRHRTFGLFLPQVSPFFEGGEGFTRSIVEMCFPEFTPDDDESNLQDIGMSNVTTSDKVNLPGQWRVYLEGEGGQTVIVTPSDFASYVADNSDEPAEPSFRGAEDIAEIQHPRYTSQEAVWEVPPTMFVAIGTDTSPAHDFDWAERAQGVFAFTKKQASDILSRLYPSLKVEEPLHLETFHPVTEEGYHEAGFVIRPLSVFRERPAELIES